MKTKKPIQAKSTERILRAVLPASFKMVNDESSNGYKFTNILAGVEIDEATDRLDETYGDSFISTIDLSNEFELYDVMLSGAPIDSYLNASGNIPIKITSENEFYNGDPTRIRPDGFISIPSGIDLSGIIGLEYFRIDERGSGWLQFNSTSLQEEAFIAGDYPVYKVVLNSSFQGSGDYGSISGIYTGIEERDYDQDQRYEILVPIKSGVLKAKYPLTREIVDDSGIVQTIDHYTPYHGWTRDEMGTVIPVVDYDTDFTYDANGEKTYYRTAFNNKYGYNNYSSAYLDLEQIPISGTLRLFDIDILDISGNASEIPESGRDIYYLMSDKMNIGNPTDDLDGNPSGAFDPVYLGYESTIPVWKGFSDYMVGQSGVNIGTTSWDYLHEGVELKEGSLTWEDGDGPITNKIRINNPQSRYMVQYSYKTHDKVKYITSLDANKYLSLDTPNPVYSTETISGNLVPLTYNFTKDPNILGKAKLISFNGLEVRPYSKVTQIDFNIPFVAVSEQLLQFKSFNLNKNPIGFSNDYIPNVSTFRNYALVCPFDQDVIANAVTESDTTGNSNTLEYTNTANNLVRKITYDSYFGKRLDYYSGDSYFGIDDLSTIKENTYYHFKFKVRQPVDGYLVYNIDSPNSQYYFAEIDNTGRITITVDGFVFYSRDKLIFNNETKEIILHYTPDDISTAIPTVSIYIKEEGTIGFREIRTTSAETDLSVSFATSTLQVYKNMTVDIDSFKLYYEAQ